MIFCFGVMLNLWFINIIQEIWKTLKEAIIIEIHHLPQEMLEKLMQNFILLKVLYQQ